MPIRAKTREKDTYFEVGIAQSLENWGNLWKKLTNWKLHFLQPFYIITFTPVPIAINTSSILKNMIAIWVSV